MDQRIVREHDHREDRLHLTVKVEGAVLPPYFIIALLAFCVFLSSACLVLWFETRRVNGELLLLQDYVEGRIDYLPYRPPAQRPQQEE